MIFFSIVIPTRDHPKEFSRALKSVLSQQCDFFEIIVVDDGPTRDVYDYLSQLKKEVGGRVN